MAQENKIIWQKAFGLVDSIKFPIYQINSTVPTSDSGYLVIGLKKGTGDTAKSFGRSDACLIKYNKNHQKQWEKYYGGKSYDELQNGIQTSDGGYIFIGTTSSNDGVFNNKILKNHDTWILKVNREGDYEWQSLVGTDSFDFGNRLIELKNKDYLAIYCTRTNQQSGDFYIEYFSICRFSKDGKLIWTKKIKSQAYYDYLETLIIARDTTSFIVAGNIAYINQDSFAKYDFWPYIVKLDLNGKVIWRKEWKKDTIMLRSLNDVIMDAEGSIVMAGAITKKKKMYDRDYWIAYFDSNANNIWERHYGGSLGENIEFIYKTVDSNFILAGTTTSDDLDVTNYYGNSKKNMYLEDIWIVKVSKTGDIIWQNNYGGSDIDDLRDCSSLKSSRYLFVSNSSSKDHDLFGLYDTISNSSVNWLFELKGLDTFDGIQENFNKQCIYIYPNPTTTTLTLQVPSATKDYYISITDMSGRKILQTRITDITDNKVDVSSLNSGVYFIKATGSSRVFHAKFVKE